MPNSDQIVIAIVIKALDFALVFLFDQLREWFKKRRAKRKHKRKPKPRHHIDREMRV